MLHNYRGIGGKSPITKYGGKLSTASIAKRRLKKTPGQTHFVRELQHDTIQGAFRQEFTAIRRGGRFIGTLVILSPEKYKVSSFNFWETLAKDGRLILDDVSTESAYERHGFMKQGLAELISWAKKQPHLHQIQLHVDLNRGTPKEAVTLYKSIGFRETLNQNGILHMDLPLTKTPKSEPKKRSK